MNKPTSRFRNYKTLRKNAVSKFARFLKNILGDVQEELEVVVDKGQVEKVRELLDIGADPNFRFGIHRTTYLHRARRAEVVKELLDHGAEVNAKDDYGCTPLYCSVNKEVPEVVGLLLENGAIVNEPDETGVTPLCLALNEHPKLELIEQLLDKGAKMCRIDASQFYSNYFTRSCAAIKAVQLPVAKLVLKFVLLQHFVEDFSTVVDLDTYSKCINYDELVSHRDKCAMEIARMKTHKINKDFSVYAYIMSNPRNIKPFSNKAPTEDEIIAKYPIYQDVILPKLRKCLERAALFDTFTDQQVCAESCGKRVTLSRDCLCLIAEYLSNSDLFNFISSFERSTEGFKCSNTPDKITKHSQVIGMVQARCNIF